MQKIRVCARDSKLSQTQVVEIYKSLQNFYPEVVFDLSILKTKGDIDLKTSLTHMDKTDFFTKELDELILEKKVDIAIHSAKDLPDPLHPKLDIFALTLGVDPTDVLLLKENQSILSLKKNARIGTSSKRREEMIKKLREDFVAQDIRGTIEERIRQLNQDQIEGLIIAKAALIRLDLLHLNWVSLKGGFAQNQGRLAVVGLKENLMMKELFHCLHLDQESYEKSSLFRDAAIQASQC